MHIRAHKHTHLQGVEEVDGVAAARASFPPSLQLVQLALQCGSEGGGGVVVTATGEGQDAAPGGGVVGNAGVEYVRDVCLSVDEGSQTRCVFGDT